jgi:hypothetical protein
MWEALGQAAEPFAMIWINDFDWAWPICEMIHFIGMALLIGSIGLLDFRMLGFFKGLPIHKLEALVPLGIAGFIANFVTGTIFILANPVGGPSAYLTTLALQIKLVLILIAGLNALAYYVTGISKQMAAIGPKDDAPLNARLIAGLSLVLWFGVILFGRLIMYNDTLLWFLKVPLVE